jgi:hypothetical protein
MVLVKMSHLFIGIIAPCTILLPVSIAIIKYVNLPITARHIFYYLLFSGCINLAAIILSYRGINNLPLLHLLTLFELFFLSRFYSALFDGRGPVMIKYGFSITMLASILNSILLQSIFTFNSYARGLAAISIMLSSFLYFIRVPENKKMPGELIIVLGLLLYYAGSFLIFLFSNYLKTGHGSSTIVWNINASLIILLYIFITVGILKCKPRTTIFISCFF